MNRQKKTGKADSLAKIYRETLEAKNKKIKKLKTKIAKAIARLSQCQHSTARGLKECRQILRGITGKAGRPPIHNGIEESREPITSKPTDTGEEKLPSGLSSDSSSNSDTPDTLSYGGI